MVTDWRGTEIEAGDRIVYAVKHSTSVEVNEAIVAELGEELVCWQARPKPFVIVIWKRSSLFGSWRKADQRLKLTNIKAITVLEKGAKA